MKEQIKRCKHCVIRVQCIEYSEDEYCWFDIMEVDYEQD